MDGASQQANFQEDSKQTNEQPKGKVICGIRWTMKKIIIAFLTVALVIVIIFLLIQFVIGPKIAQKSIDDSQLNLSSSSITDPTETGFKIASTGSVSGAGSLSASLSFPDPVTVSWANRANNAPDLVLGTIQLAPISVDGSSGKGVVTLNTRFSVTMPQNMADFATYMIHGAQFSWRLNGNAQASALGLTFKGLSINKIATLAGFNGLAQVDVLGFDATQGDNNTVNTRVYTNINNPSNITMQMGDLYFDFTLGTGMGKMSAADITMVPGLNPINMTGLIDAPVNSTFEDLDTKIKELFSTAVDNVVPVTVTGNHVLSNNVSISWLNTAFKTLSLQVKMDLTNIAQKSVTGAQLSLASTSISEIQETSFALSGTGEAAQAGFMDATMKFPSPINVYWVPSADTSDILLGKLPLLPVSISGPAPKSGPLNISTTFTITNTTGMSEFSASLINNDYFTWKLVGVAEAVAYGLTFTNLTLTKTITLAGFSGLKKVSITQFDLPASGPDGIHIQATSSILNPSEITMSMGDVSFNMFSETTAIGSLTTASLTVTPGSNSLSMVGAMKVADQSVLSKQMNNFLNGKNLDTGIVGDSSSRNASWLNSALKQLKLEVSVPAPKLNRPIVNGIKIAAMELDMDPNDKSGMTTLLSAPQVTANFNPPYKFPITLQNVQQTLTFIDISSNTSFATLQTPVSPATADLAAASLSTSFSQGSFKAIPGQEALFAGLMAVLTVKDSAVVAIAGSATSLTNTAAGNAEITLPIHDTLELSGFGGFRNLQVLSTRVVGGSNETGLKLIVQINLHNPSTITLKTNTNITLDLFFEGVRIGESILPNMQVVPGDNILDTTCFVRQGNDQASYDAVRKMMSEFIVGGTIQTIIQGSTDSIPYKSLQPAFSTLSIPATIIGPQNEPTVQYARFYPTTFAQDFSVFNPLDTPFTLTRLVANISLYWNETFPENYLGLIDHVFDPPFIVQPKTNNTTPKIGLKTLKPANRWAGACLFTFKLPICYAKAVQTLYTSIGTYNGVVDQTSPNVTIYRQ